MSDLMQKLAISKAIMDRHNTMGRGNAPEPTNIQTPMVESYDVPAANFNIPSEFISESNIPSAKSELPPKDRILNSKLPDEIKRLMIENPIQVVNPLSASNTSVLSDELIEKASKLMGTNKPQQPQPQRQNVSESVLDNKNLRSMLKEVVQEVLKENGLITESTSKSDEVMMIKVGKHIFEGKISKVKKLK